MRNLALESIQTYGSKSVADWQLITALGIPEKATRELMQLACGLIGNIAKMSIIELARIDGITTQKATMLQAALELGRRRQSEPAQEKKFISSSLDCYDHLIVRMRDALTEEFHIIHMDRRSKIIAIECIHIGGMSAMVVDPKIIFQQALKYRSCSIILSHNHPSGAPSPSIEDIRLTEKIKQCGSFLDIKVLDHIIIGDGSYYSFADEGKM